MSILFFDHLMVFEAIEKNIKSLELTNEERDELSHLIEDMIHHRALSTVLEKLPMDDHNEFLEKFVQSPFDDSLVEYINFRIDGDISEILAEEFNSLENEILEYLNG